MSVIHARNTKLWVNGVLIPTWVPPTRPVNICGTCGCLHRSHRSDCNSCRDAVMRVRLQLAMASIRRSLESGLFYGPPILSRFYEPWCADSGVPHHEPKWAGPTMYLCATRDEAQRLSDRLTPSLDALVDAAALRLNTPRGDLLKPVPMPSYLFEPAPTEQDARLARLKQHGPKPRGEWWRS